MTTRERVVEIARDELGNSDPKPYWRETLGFGWVGPFPPHWCGAFALYCLRRAGLTDWKWVVGKGFLYQLRRTQAPQPGDIGYLDQPFQHHYVVAEVGEHTLTSIDGNQGSPGVQERHRAVNGKSVFYSIQPLVDAVELQSRDTEPPAPPSELPRPTLRLGSTGPAVVELQNRLNRYMNAGLVADGAFGPKTSRAVQTYQRDKNLDADGVVGAKTWAALLK